MLKLQTKAELEALHTGNVKEGLHLEYKASDAIDKMDDSKKIEMARDVSAFANADGGQIVYGMTEKDHEPAGLDQGLDAKAYPEIWFEQVLQQHITPKIAGIRPRHVSLGKSMVAVVIDVPATEGDPHQVSDGRYYRRHNFNRLIMEHYEIRDAIRRILDRALQLEFELFKGDAAYKNVEFSTFRDLSDPIALERFCPTHQINHRCILWCPCLSTDVCGSRTSVASRTWDKPSLVQTIKGITCARRSVFLVPILFSRN
jgi:hypothetical protein